MEHGPLGARPVNIGDNDISALIERMTRQVPDFPEPGIAFKDLTPLLADAQGLAAVTDALGERGA